MALPATLTSVASACLHVVPTLVLLWLAFFFGRTLQPGATPLIERIARQGKPVLSPTLCRYTRGLTALWCAYFVVAGTLGLTSTIGLQHLGLGVVAASASLFVGEYWLRRRLFPGEFFPGFVQQVRDTVRVWRPRRDV
jgi:uncharacterized membrane protein